MPFSTIVRVESFTGKDGHLREPLLEFCFSHYSRAGENFVERNRLPSAINQPPSLKVGKADSVSIEHSEFDAYREDLGAGLVRGALRLLFE